MEINSVGVVGAGQMGNGIAHVMALAGYEVRLNDISQDALDRAIGLIGKNMDRQVSREKISAEERDAAMARIVTTLALKDVAQTDLVIEAATEREEIKHKIFETLLPDLKPETILTSNTSSISITRLASRTDRPEKFMGFHFMNPVPVMQLVELIRGIATDEETFKACKAVVAPMRERGGGSIINISSLAAVFGLPYGLDYVASKAAVIGMTRGMARELGDDNIRVNAVAPSAVMTEGTEEFFGEKFDKAKKVIASGQLIKRNLETSDLTGTIVYLASDNSAFVTGQTHMVDGGSWFL